MATAAKKTEETESKRTRRVRKKANTEIREVRDTNPSRRDKYDNNPDYREKIKAGNRRSYSRRNPQKNGQKQTGRLLIPSTEREVQDTGERFAESIFVIGSYTIPEAAQALGKTVMTFKKWISTEILPPPILVCTTYMYQQYSEGELQLIAKHLAEHSKTYRYISETHEDFIHRMWQDIEVYRKTHI